MVAVRVDLALLISRRWWEEAVVERHVGEIVMPSATEKRGVDDDGAWLIRLPLNTPPL
jgi:hypothetical protein